MRYVSARSATAVALLLAGCSGMMHITSGSDSSVANNIKRASTGITRQHTKAVEWIEHVPSVMPNTEMLNKLGYAAYAQLAIKKLGSVVNITSPPTLNFSTTPPQILQGKTNTTSKDRQYTSVALQVFQKVAPKYPSTPQRLAPPTPQVYTDTPVLFYKSPVPPQDPSATVLVSAPSSAQHRVTTARQVLGTEAARQGAPMVHQTISLSPAVVLEGQKLEVPAKKNQIAEAPKVREMLPEKTVLVSTQPSPTPPQKPQDLTQITHNLPEISPKSTHTLPPTPPVQHTTLTPENTQKPADLVVKTAVSTPAPWGVSDSESGLSKGKRGGSKAKKRAYTKAVSTTLPPRNPGGDSPESEEDSGNNPPARSARQGGCVAPGSQSVVAGPEVAEQRSDPTTYTAPTTEAAEMMVETAELSEDDCNTTTSQATTMPEAHTNPLQFNLERENMFPVSVEFLPPSADAPMHQASVLEAQATGEPDTKKPRIAEDSTSSGGASSDLEGTNPESADPSNLFLDAVKQSLCSVSGNVERVHLMRNQDLDRIKQQLAGGQSDQDPAKNTSRPSIYDNKTHNHSQHVPFNSSVYVLNNRIVCIRTKDHNDGVGSDVFATIEQALNFERHPRYTKALSTLLTTNPAALREELLPITRMDNLRLRERAQDYLRQIEEHEMAQLPIPHAEPASSATHHHPMR